MMAQSMYQTEDAERADTSQDDDVVDAEFEEKN